MKNNQYFYYNFYLIKNYYFLYYFVFNQKFVNFDKNFNKLYFYKNNFNVKNTIYLKKNLILLSYKLNIFFNNFFKNYFSSIIFNEIYFYNHFFNKNFILFFFNFNLKKNNFLILDSLYTYIYPFYKYVFGLNNLTMYKNFFFLKPVYFTRKNWSYFFLKFCLYNNIKLLFISDYNYYSNFYKNISYFDCSISAIVPYNYSESFVDYPLYTNFLNNFIKIMYFSMITQIYFYSYNYNNFLIKFKYLNNFFKYICLNKNLI